MTAAKPRGVMVAVAPEVARPRQAVTATVTTDMPLDEITSVRLEWGYGNFYRYHSAGERDAEDWVCVTRLEIPVAAGEFTGTTSTFTVPPWAPGSSDQIARWSCRLTVQRDGRDIEARGDFTVAITVDDVDPVEALEAPMEHVSGDAEIELEIVLPTSVFSAGQTVSGHVVLTPRADLPDGDLAVYWQRHRDSHPMVRQPGQGETLDGRIAQLGRGIHLQSGAGLTLPFEFSLPDDAPPTADAVHSSLSWFVGARLSYPGPHGDTAERVRRPIIVANA
jgi:hypothetical protein